MTVEDRVILYRTVAFSVLVPPQRPRLEWDMEYTASDPAKRGKSGLFRVTAGAAVVQWRRLRRREFCGRTQVARNSIRSDITPPLAAMPYDGPSQPPCHSTLKRSNIGSIFAWCGSRGPIYAFIMPTLNDHPRSRPGASRLGGPRAQFAKPTLARSARKISNFLPI
ncbi:hypothetical protein BDZ91DRAFT_766846 [Kalaharituber pfeilii]|nr:hypothetical protein BDZ91DRAFT_766846 [Kalaharituber pfeilii]